MRESISDNLAVTVAEAGGLELSSEILEFSIDQVINEGLLKDIPFVGWIAKGVSIGRSIADRILYNKILRFLITLEKIHTGDIGAFRKRVNEDIGFRRKVGEHLLVLLDRIDTFDKATLLAQCFDHFLSGDISHEYFVDLSHVIERSPVSYLRALAVPDSRRIRFGSISVAVACGILEFGITEPETGEKLPQLGTRMSRYGRDLRDMVLGRFREQLAKEKERKEQLARLYSSRRSSESDNNG